MLTENFTRWDPKSVTKWAVFLIGFGVCFGAVFGADVQFNFRLDFPSVSRSVLEEVSGSFFSLFSRFILDSVSGLFFKVFSRSVLESISKLIWDAEISRRRNFELQQF